MFVLFNVTYRRFVEDARMVAFFGAEMRWENFRFGATEEGVWLSCHLVGSNMDESRHPRVGSLTMELVPVAGAANPLDWKLLFYEIDLLNGTKWTIELNVPVNLEQMQNALLDLERERQQRQQAGKK